MESKKEDSEFAFRVTPYDVRIIFCVSDNCKESVEKHKKLFGQYASVITNPTGGTCIHSSFNNIGIFISRSSLSHNTIAHEILHACYGVFDNYNIKFSYRNHEHVAYLVGWVTEKIYNFLRDKNEVINLNDPYVNALKPKEFS